MGPLWRFPANAAYRLVGFVSLALLVVVVNTEGRCVGLTSGSLPGLACDSSPVIVATAAHAQGCLAPRLPRFQHGHCPVVHSNTYGNLPLIRELLAPPARPCGDWSRGMIACAPLPHDGWQFETIGPHRG